MIVALEILSVSPVQVLVMVAVVLMTGVADVRKISKKPKNDLILGASVRRCVGASVRRCVGGGLVFSFGKIQ